MSEIPQQQDHFDILADVYKGTPHEENYRDAADELRRREAAIEVCQKVMKFWGSHAAWGDFASLTSAAGAFAPIADAARAAVEWVDKTVPTERNES